MVRNLKVAARNPMSLLFTLIQPIVWMILFTQNVKMVGSLAVFRHLGYSSYLAFFIPSVMALTVLNSSARSGISMITDVNTGVMDKYLISPIRRSSILLGRVLADAIAMAVQCLIVLAIAFAMGASTKIGVGGVAAAFGLTILLGICAAAFCDFVALRSRNVQITMMISAFAAFPLLLISPAFFPTQLQPTWLQWVGKFNPVAYVITSGQDLMNVGVRWGQLMATLGVIALTGLVCFTASIRAFRRATSGSGRRHSHRNTQRDDPRGPCGNAPPGGPAIA
jgi:ABC-2 type transport system permease protein